MREINYQVDVDSSLARKSKDLFLENLFGTLGSRIKVFKYSWQKEDWDVFMLVFTGSDRLEHFLWDAFENENHKYHLDFLNYFKKIDEVIGDIADRIGKNNALLVLSDHGMEGIKTNFYVNRFLKESGFLKLDESRKNYNQIKRDTKAFALDPGRIYLNKKSKYPRGEVKENEGENIIEELISAFSEAEYQGERIIKKIYRKEEIYQGKYLEQAPDLVLIENSGFRLRGSIEKDILFEKDIFTGKHTLEDSFLYMRDKNNQEIIPENPKVEDIKSILEKI